MQYKGNHNEPADVAFLRRQLALAKALSARNIEFAIIPFISVGKDEVKTYISVDRLLYETFVTKEQEARHG